jgi:hypothetical protein
MNISNCDIHCALCNGGTDSIIVSGAKACCSSERLCDNFVSMGPFSRASLIQIVILEISRAFLPVYNYQLFPEHLFSGL